MRATERDAVVGAMETIDARHADARWLPAEALYLDLLKKCLTRSAFGEPYQPVLPRRQTLRWYLFAPVQRLLARRRLILCRRVRFDSEARAAGRDWPAEAETMIGVGGLDRLQGFITDVLRRDVPGDFIETGVWRGGATIFMRAVLKVYGDTKRVVWAADSFEGLPKPDPERFSEDKGDILWTLKDRFAVSLDDVKANFSRYGLLDDQVRFLPGWFRDTLPGAPIKRLAFLRLDGDMYESTMDALQHLYPKLSKGGYVYVDDYGLPGCRAAVNDYRAGHGITAGMQFVGEDGQHAAYWRQE